MRMEEPTSEERTRIVSALADGGCVAPAEEADALFGASSEGVGPIDELVARRVSGEPLAWITGSVVFGGIRVHVGAGVFVPRPHTEAMAHRAASLLPDTGIAVDLCTGSGAVACVLASAHPQATVVGTEVDPLAVACARRNGVAVLVGDFDEPLPPSMSRRVDVMTAVVPYVPTEDLPFLPRDVLANEPRAALDGGPRGTALLVRAAETAPHWLRPGASVLLELGGDQASEVAAAFERVGLSGIRVYRDDDGQDRAIEARAEP
jgi:release factor glutamine methyltransferase